MKNIIEFIKAIIIANNKADNHFVVLGGTDMIQLDQD